MGRALLASLPLLPLLLAAGEAMATERVAGTVVAIAGEAYVVDLGEEEGVSPGTVLLAFRQLPSPRGSAEFRGAAIWWDVGRLTVRSLGDGVAVATWGGPAAAPLPAGLDESGAPPERVQVGDRVRVTAAIAEMPVPVRVSFSLADLFTGADVALEGDGAGLMRHWLSGLRSVEGPIEVEVHARIEELGETAPDLSRELSLDDDAPFGPAPGEPVVPVEALYEGAPEPAEVPPGREVFVIDGGEGGPEVWRYLDPVTLARRRGEQVAAALSAHLGLPPAAVLVRVVPRATPAGGLAGGVPGYDEPGEQIRIVAPSIDWVEPEPVPEPARARKKDAEDGSPVRPHRRRLLERPPEDVS